MSTPIITVENLSKRYHLGQIGTTTLRDSAQRLWHRLRGKNSGYLAGKFATTTSSDSGFKSQPSSLPPSPDEFWALKDVSFEVQPGEVLGIIGRNGAGKSTLLKILSRITEPTSGRTVIRGRVASLLEVGTGFHPELSGRENIFLNGAILGMKKVEIARKFDEIVSFSEVEKFIDTPVKHYSSGMYVRLAFAVAAHLEPEILIVDEVLAVGDAEFQKKCLGKMQDVAKRGRTVLFVSHQMAAVTRLCQRAILIESGQIIEDGPADVVSSRYLISRGSKMGARCWSIDSAPGDDVARLLALRVKQQGVSTDSVDIRKPIELEMDFLNRNPQADLICGLSLFNDQGIQLFNAVDFDNQLSKYDSGKYRAKFTIPGNLFTEGVVRICAEVSTRAPVYQIHFLESDAAAFQVIDNGEPGSVRAGWGRPIPGVVRPKVEWSIDPI